MPATIDLLICAQQIKDAALKASSMLSSALERHVEGDWVSLDAEQAVAAHDAMESADELVKLIGEDYADNDETPSAVLLRKAGNVFAYSLATVKKYPEGNRGHEAHAGRSHSAVRQLEALAREAQAYLEQQQGVSA